MCNVVTIKADDSNMRETTDIVNKLNKLFEGTSLVAEIVTKETRSMNGKTSYESYIKIEKDDWMEKERIVGYVYTPKGVFAKTERMCSYPNLGNLMDEKNITIPDLAKYLQSDLHYVEQKMSGYIWWDLRDMLRIKKFLNTDMSLDDLFYSDWEIDL